MIQEIDHFTTRVESELLHVQDRMYQVRDLSITLNGRENTFATVLNDIFHRLFENIRVKTEQIS